MWNKWNFQLFWHYVAKVQDGQLTKKVQKYQAMNFVELGKKFSRILLI